MQHCGSVSGALQLRAQRVCPLSTRSWCDSPFRSDAERRLYHAVAFPMVSLGVLVLFVSCVSLSPSTEHCVAEAAGNVEAALSHVDSHRSGRAPHLLKTMQKKLVVPEDSFPSSSSLYHRIFYARKLLAQRSGGAELPKSLDTTRLEGLLRSPAYKKILEYPGDLWPGERQQRSFPPTAEFDWGSLSQQPVPGFVVQPLPSWMQSADPRQEDLAPTYVNIRNKVALLNAAWFSCPNAFRTRKGQDEFTADCFEEADSASVSDVKEQEEIGKVPRLLVPLYTPALDRRMGRPLNPLLFTARCCASPEGPGSDARCSTSSSLPRHHVTGRGVLGKWGANHAADALLTARNPVNGRLQVALILRTDGSGKFAVPGGFVDPTDGPLIVTPILRELLEEAVSYEDGDNSEESQQRYRETLGALRNIFGPFRRDSQTGIVTWENEEEIKWGHPIYAGYVDDERNTENAWMETTVLHWHVSDEDYKHLHLRAGDDATLGSAAFYDIDDDPRLVAMNVDPLKDLYASHSSFLVKAIKTHFPDETVLLTKLGDFSW
ncbi:nudix -type motif 9 isoform a family protein [Toxoplasma gondii TgCatPRC2]|uniref:Nudix-type motif 9 isoform a family protein n=1 Tax=Toxoplasma gondii TgCatPRC2 TaxID=1130821 RepID=A0A151HG42_TOXGO|nr:nudix -type motif 9 isoform a family protein [Toxoplasma gondii TgCatPRC2]